MTANIFPQQALRQQNARAITTKVSLNGNLARVSWTFSAANPEAGTKTTEFTRTDFKDAPDRASRPQPFE